MPAFLEHEFWSLANPELWVAVGLLCFLAVLVVAGVPKLVFGMLDSKAAKIQEDLNEAARLRAEAEALLADLKVRSQETEALAAQMLKEAQAEAKRLETEAKAKLEDSIARRAELADRRIAVAEAQAAQEVKSAAADLAAQLAERMLADRIRGARSDASVDGAIAQLATRLQ